MVEGFRTRARLLGVLLSIDTALIVWLSSGITAARLNVPNFAAKLHGQECDCLINEWIGSLDLRIQVGDISLSAWMLFPSVLLSAVSAGMLIRIIRFSQLRPYLNLIKKASVIGLIASVSLSSILVADHAFSTDTLYWRPALFNAPNFKVVLTNGSTIEILDLKGKALILEFMAPWCEHCIEQVQELKHVYIAFNSNITILSVSIDQRVDSIQALRRFNEEHGVTWLSGLDIDGGASKLQVKATPTIFIIDSQGRIRYSYVGTTLKNDLIRNLSYILDKATMDDQDYNP